MLGHKILPAIRVSVGSIYGTTDTKKMDGDFTAPHSEKGWPITLPPSLKSPRRHRVKVATVAFISVVMQA